MLADLANSLFLVIAGGVFAVLCVAVYGHLTLGKNTLRRSAEVTSWLFGYLYVTIFFVLIVTVIVVSMGGQPVWLLVGGLSAGIGAFWMRLKWPATFAEHYATAAILSKKQVAWYVDRTQCAEDVRRKIMAGKKVVVCHDEPRLSDATFIAHSAWVGPATVSEGDNR